MRWWQKASTIILAPLAVAFFAAHMNPLAIMLGGFFVMGMGEWINHLDAEVPRNANVPGMLLEFAGVALALYGIYSYAVA
jgi:hypothetical protein